MKKIGLLLLVLLCSISINAQEFHVEKSDENLVKFISDAPIEDFEGITSTIDGYLYFEDGDYTNNSAIYFEVDLRTLDTGIGLRNRHMRENYLETENFPFAKYSGKIVSTKKLSDNKIEVSVEGEMDVHGVKLPQNITGTITVNGDVLTIESEFIVKLSDHEIEVPSLMFMKIDEDMQLIVSFKLKKV